MTKSELLIRHLAAISRSQRGDDPLAFPAVALLLALREARARIFWRLSPADRG